MGLLFTPIGFLPNTPVKSSDINANFAALQSASSIWGEWLNYWTGGLPTKTTTQVVNGPFNLTLEDYTTQDPVFAPNGIQEIRIRPSFDNSLYSSLGMALSAVNNSTSNIYDAIYMQIGAFTFIRFGLKHGNGKQYYSASAAFSATGAGTFNHGDQVTPTRAKFNYGFNSNIGSAQTIGYSSLGSTTVTVAVSSSSVPWTGHVFNG